MNRYTMKRGDELQYSAWLVADSDGGLKLLRREPSTGRSEISCALMVRVPLSLFRKPLLRAEVVVPPQAGITDADAIKAVASVVQQGCDFEVEVSAKAPN